MTNGDDKHEYTERELAMAEAVIALQERVERGAWRLKAFDVKGNFLEDAPADVETAKLMFAGKHVYVVRAKEYDPDLYGRVHHALKLIHENETFGLMFLTPDIDLVRLEPVEPLTE